MNMRKIMILVVMVAAFVLPTMAQNYGAQQMNASFQSTSTMMGSGSTYSSNPTINENGVASAPASSPAKAPSGPSRIGNFDNVPEGGVQENISPVGDAVMPMILMAMVYAVYSVARVYRRKRRI